MSNQSASIREKITSFKYVNIPGFFEGLVLSNSSGYVTFHKDTRFLDQVYQFIFGPSNKPVIGFQFLGNKEMVLVGSNGMVSHFKTPQETTEFGDSSMKKKEY